MSAVGQHPGVSELCIECGMCCSGAVYPSANLRRDEVEQAQAKEFQVIAALADEPQEYAFALPCHYLAGTACTIYGQWRPRVCAEFFCSLAIGLGQGKVSAVEAGAKVQTAHDLQAQIKPLLEAGETWNAANARWNAGMSNWPVVPEVARFHLLMTTFNLYLDRHFRRPSERRIGEKQAE
jgi:uncharacterized protein